jgi:hypothetical protein
MRSGGRRRAIGTLGQALALLLAGSAAIVHAQNADGSNATVTLSDKLPRPGYEPRTLRLGSATLSTDLGIETRYDSNVFAVSVDPIDDVIFIATPHVGIEGKTDQLTYQADAFADIRQYVDNGSESYATFGFAGSGTYIVSSNHRIGGGARLERLVETRNDPEANTNTGQPPRRVDTVAGDLSYSYQGSRLGIDVRGEARQLDYRPEDEERSLAIYFLAVRASLVAAPFLSVFVQPYINRRDFDLAFDQGGVDRDATTFGVTGGVRLLTTDRWTGEIGVGGFRSNPDDPTLDSFSGFAASANLIWSPSERTRLTLRGSSGDTATVRTGATGRTDSSINLRLDQEVRHNLRFSANIGYQKTAYNGLDNNLRTGFGATQIEYLINQYASAFLTASYAERRADPATDGFDRGYVGLGVRLRH